MAEGRPGFSVATTQGEGAYKGSCSIEDQEGFYGQSPVPDMDKRAGQMPASPGDRFGANIFTDKK